MLISPVNAQVRDTSATLTKDSLTISADSVIADSLILADDLKSKVVYHARDSIVYELSGQRVLLYGNAEITYEDINLKAAFIEINYDTRILSAEGLPDSTGTITGVPVFKQADDEFTSQKIRYNFDTKRGKISDVVTKEGDSYVHGTTVKKQPDNTTYIRNGYYTTCSLPHPHYFIYANKIKVIPNEKIVTGPANMVVADVPTPLFLPFGFFPNSKGRSSGVLFPAYGESSQLGFYLSNGGYYFGFSDYFDVALTGDIYSQGSWRANMYSNYAARYRFNGNLSVNYSFTKISQPELPDYSEEKGFFIRWMHMQDAKARPNSNFSANVNAGSATFYRNNITSANNYLTNTFQSSVAYSKTWAGKPYSFSSSLSHSQNTATRDVSLSLPSATFAVSRINLFKNKGGTGKVKWYEKLGVSYTSTLLNRISTKDTLLFREESLDQFTYGLQHSIPISTSLTAAKFFTVTPSFTYNERWYLKTFEQRYIPESQGVTTDTVNGFKAARDFAFSTSVNTRLYGVKQFTKGKIAAIRHVITPAMAFTFRPDFSEKGYGNFKSVQVDSTGRERLYSIFEGTVFGGPAAGKSALLGFSLDNNLEMKTRQVTDTAVNLKKIKILESLALNANYNFAADSLRLSVIGITGRTTILERLNISFASTFDPYVRTVQGVRLNTTHWDQSKRLARFDTGNLSVNFTIAGKRKENAPSATGSEAEEVNKNREDYLDFSIPFNLSVGYNFYYVNNIQTPDLVTQTLNFSGDITVTPNWKVNFNSGYDFEQKDISYTSLGIYRDLHCWEMRLNWVPFGFQQNYFFQINVKSSVLQDLKLTKRNDRFDRR